MRILLLCLGAVVLGSPLEAQKSRRRCSGTAVDSLAPGERVYRDCEVDRVAKPRGDIPRPQWTPTSTPTSVPMCYRAEFEFVVDTLGVPEAATIRRLSSSDASFELAVREQIDRMRYEPAQLDGRRVRQLVVHQSKVAVARVVSSSPSGSPPRMRAPMC